VSRVAARALCALLALGLPPAGRAEDGPDAPAWDPIEQLNRDLFYANDGIDRHALEPIARGWEFITHPEVRLAIDRFFTNLRFPVRLVGALGQGRAAAAGVELLRFGVNSTVGVAGLFDPATGLGLGFHPEDCGQALAKWRVPQGPYLVLPVFNASTGRDSFGFVVDLALVPTYLLPAGIGFGLSMLDTINRRALALQDVRTARQASLDFYGFARSAYLERRWQQIHDAPDDRSRAGGVDEDLYEIEEELP
jgi:phospholipid-binding lipoprotein MlaA